MSDRIVTLRVPTAENSASMNSGIKAALASLRGWMLIGDEDFKKEREKIWKHKILPALDRLKQLSVNWTNPENVIRLREIEKLTMDLAELQKKIEDISHTPENVPSTQMLFDQAIPKAEVIVKKITEIIDLEAMEPDIANRKFLLGVMADVRGSFSLSLANIRAYLLSGGDRFRISFEAEWSRHESRFNDLEKYQKLLTKNQIGAFKVLKVTQKEFAMLPRKMIQLRGREDWNLANYWLATKAAPISKRLSALLDDMSENQQQLLEKDGVGVQKHIEKLIGLQGILIVIGTLISLGFSFFISHSITGPLSRLIVLAKKLSKGDYRPEVSTASSSKTTSETSVLRDAMERMGQDIYDTLQKVRKSEALTRTLMDTAIVGFITINDQGIIESFNQASEQMFGYSSDEVLGKNVKLLMPEPDRGNHDGYLARYLKTGKAKIIGFGKEVTGLRKSGELFPISLSVNKVDSPGKVIFSGVLSDLTEQKRIQNQLIQSSKLASVGELSTGVAHELNQPISYIRGLAQVEIEGGKDAFDPDSIYDTLKDVVEGTDRMMLIINHLRNFSRESNETSFSDLSLDHVLESSFVLLNTQLKSRGIEVVKHIAENLPSVSGNANQLEQVFVNLLTNARDALQDVENPEVCIEMKQQDSKVLITYADNGKGIPLEIQSKIFDPFFTTKDIGEGTGLGMSISYGIIKEHKGTINFTSKEGKGTTFTIALPISRNEEKLNEK